MAHVLTKEYEQTLRRFAERLPLPEVQYKKPMRGREILIDYPELKQMNGKPINPDELYLVGSEVNATNHFRRLKAAYLEGGQPAVVQYLVPYLEFIKETE